MLGTRLTESPSPGPTTKHLVTQCHALLPGDVEDAGGAWDTLLGSLEDAGGAWDTLLGSLVLSL